MSARLPRLPLAILTLAAGLRLWGFWTAGPLWIDELFMAVNLRELGFVGLLGPMLEGQNGPVGWLWMEKILWVAAAESDRLLRAPALLASLLSLPLTWELARRALGERAAPAALAAVALSPFALWQSFQIKPYALDLCAALILFVLALRWLEVEPDRGRFLALTLAGVVLSWFSLPLIFTLAGVGGTIFLARADRRRSACVLGAAWLLSFGTHYLLFLRPRPQPAWLYDFWADGLLAWPLTGVADLQWLFWAVSSTVEDPAGQIGFGTAGALLIVLGLAASLRPSASPAEAQQALARRLLAAPVLVALLAAALRLYPFASRLVLFLLPSLVILGIYGLVTLLRPVFGAVAGRPQLAEWPAWAWALVPAIFTVHWLPSGGLPLAADSRALFAQLQEEHRPGEPVVLGHLATYAWPRYGVGLEAEIHETPSAWSHRARPRELRSTLDRVAAASSGPGPVWVVLTRVQERLSPPGSYGAFLDEQTTWPPLSIFREALASGWRIEEEVQVYGGALWRVLPASAAEEDGEGASPPSS
ncbi:MAG: hypothetical protein AAF725_10300 [Acidobacteriota bacterium]